MNKTTCIKLGCMLVGVMAFSALVAKADTFGSGANVFTIGFVNIGNPGNADDDVGPVYTLDGGFYATPYGGVSYAYRMGIFEVSQDAITKATASGLASVTAGAWIGSQPAANMTWFEAAAFVNWLNTSTGHVAAYQLNAGATALTLWSSAQAWQAGGENPYRNKDAYYFLPSEDEWYKAAFHKNDGVTADYWDYATGSNTRPTNVNSGTAAGTVVASPPAGSPAAVNNAGGLSSYGTMGQDGNVWEWQESALDGVNDSPSENRTIRGGSFALGEFNLRSSNHASNGPTNGTNTIGFRVASAEAGTGSVPEPSIAVLLIGSGLTLFLRRRRAFL